MSGIWRWSPITVQISCISCQHNLLLWITHILHSHTYISSLHSAVQSSSHIKSYHCTFFGQSLKHSIARDYFARSTSVIKNNHCTFLGQSLEHLLLGIILQGVPQSSRIIIVHFLDSLSSIYCWGLFCKEYHRHQE